MLVVAEMDNHTLDVHIHHIQSALYHPDTLVCKASSFIQAQCYHIEPTTGYSSSQVDSYSSEAEYMGALGLHNLYSHWKMDRHRRRQHKCALDRKFYTIPMHRAVRWVIQLASGETGAGLGSTAAEMVAVVDMWEVIELVSKSIGEVVKMKFDTAS